MPLNQRPDFLDDDFFLAAGLPARGAFAAFCLADFATDEAPRALPPAVVLPEALAADFLPPKIFSQLFANLPEAPECRIVIIAP